MALKSELSGPMFPIGIFVMTGGTLIQELLLSTDQNGVTTDPVPTGMLAALVAGLVVGVGARDRERGAVLGFASGYVGVILGSGLYAVFHWGLRSEALPNGWVVFLVGGLLIGIAFGWIPALLAAGCSYLGAFLGARLPDHTRAVGPP